MAFAKTIKLFLIDGEPNGRMTCELSNWTGKAYKIPRVKVKVCTDREELQNPGFYLLFGKDDTGEDLVYIGEAESVFSRLNQQVAQKDYWNEAITFISKDENLNKAHIKYLEHRLHELALEANRYIVKNSVIPTRSSISESDQAELEEFISNAKILVNALGHKVFERKREFVSDNNNQTNIFYLKGARGAEAIGMPTSDGFVVQQGSVIASSTVPSYPPRLIQFRNKLIEKDKINKTLEFTDDYIFSSPSAAASIIMGRKANGLTEWKLANGTTLKDYESEIN